MRISFMNELSAYTEAVGADIESVRMAIGADNRIGKRFLFAGVGYGGSCFPKDVRALKTSAAQAGTPLGLVEATENANTRQTERFAERVIARFGGKEGVRGKHFAIWGIAFKPNTDDTREAPSFLVIDRLLELGASVSVYDPEAMDGAERRYGKNANITYSRGMYECLDKADALVIVTEWSEFRQPDFKSLKERMKSNIIFDGRNLFDVKKVAEQGFEYHSVGRVSALQNELQN
jgi:UDPglucose 6-dehydrogenase